MAQTVTRQWPALPTSDPESLALWARQITRLLQEGAIVDGLGPGDVVGPAGSVGDGNVPLFDGTTGELLEDSGFPLSASGNHWGVIPRIDSSGVMEIGRIIDFHNTDADGADFAVRLRSDSFTDRLQVQASSPASTRDVDVTATVAEVRAATAGNFGVTAALLESAAAGVALTDAATVAVNWDNAINFTLTVTANRIIGNPTNGQPGTWRTILVQGNDATDRVITFDTQYLGEIPVITDADSGRKYLLMIYCVSTTHFVVSSKRAQG